MLAKDLVDSTRLSDPNNFVEPGMPVCSFRNYTDTKKFFTYTETTVGLKTDIQSTPFGNLVFMTQRNVTSVGQDITPKRDPPVVGVYRKFCKVDVKVAERVREESRFSQEELSVVDSKALFA